MIVRPLPPGIAGPLPQMPRKCFNDLDLQAVIRELDMCSSLHRKCCLIKTPPASAWSVIQLREYLKQQIKELDELRKAISGFVYFMRTTRNVVSDGKRRAWKVGMSRNPSKRKQTLESGWAGELEIYMTIKTDDSRQLESSFHDLFGQYRIHGEWFDLDRASEPNTPATVMKMFGGDGEHMFDISEQIAACQRNIEDVVPKALTAAAEYWREL